jgi:formate hydrogenlyase regulatory protein HycA
VGRLADGRLFILDWQLGFNKAGTVDYLCTFVFDKDGKLSSQLIESLGPRTTLAMDDAKYDAALADHLRKLGKHEIVDIWVRPFSVKHDGLVFGLIPRRLEDGSWRVEFMPGNTLSFYPPWDEGGYDT